jgi:hypothetical protein
MRAYLRVKLLSLAAESKIIRKEMRKYEGPTEVYQGLHLHRTIDVREESRVSHIAMGFLKGLTYKQIEAKCYIQPSWKRVKQLILKYGEGKTQDIEQAFEKWKAA